MVLSQGLSWDRGPELVASGAEVPFPRGSVTWLLAGGLSPSPCGPSTGPLGCPHTVAAASLGASDSPGDGERERQRQTGRERERSRWEPQCLLGSS